MPQDFNPQPFDRAVVMFPFAWFIALRIRSFFQLLKLMQKMIKVRLFVG